MGDTLNVDRPYMRLASMVTGNLGSLPTHVVRYYTEHADLIPVALNRGFEFPDPGRREEIQKSFELEKYLGVVRVSEDYQHATRLPDFCKKFRSDFVTMDRRIVGGDFGNSPMQLRPGDTFVARIFRCKSRLSPNDHLAFLIMQRALFLGIEGLSLVWEFKRNALPRNICLSVLGKEDDLWRDSCGAIWYPTLSINWRREYFLGLDQFPGTKLSGEWSRTILFTEAER